MMEGNLSNTVSAGLSLVSAAGLRCFKGRGNSEAAKLFRSLSAEFGFKKNPPHPATYRVEYGDGVS